MDNDAVKSFRKRRSERLKKRMDAEDDGRWITTENNHKVHIGKGGKPDKGNPHVISKMSGVPTSKEELEKAVSKCAKTEKSIADALKKAGYTGFKNKSADSMGPNFVCDTPDGGRFRVFVGMEYGKKCVKVQEWKAPSKKQLLPDREIDGARAKIEGFIKKYEGKKLPKLEDMSDEDLYNYVLATSFRHYRQTGKPVKECLSDAIENANAHKESNYEHFKNPSDDLDTAEGRKRFLQAMIDQMK